jgi:hypothetical protein
MWQDLYLVAEKPKKPKTPAAEKLGLITEQVQEALCLFPEDGPTTEQLVQATGLKKKQLYDCLARMQGKKEIEKIPTGNNGQVRWRRK